MIPELAEERLILRGWKRADFPAFADFYGNADLTRCRADIDDSA